MLIIKKQASSSTNYSVEEAKDYSIVPTPFSSMFLLHWNEAKETSAKYHVLRRFWLALQLEGAMPDSVPQEMLKNRLAYEFLEMDHKMAKVSFPEKCQANLEAARKYNIKDMQGNMKVYTEIAIKSEQGGGDTMETKEKKTERTGVAPFYLEIFEKQKTAKLTDEMIADVIEQKTGNRPTSKGVASYRCYFNAGTVKGQKTAPKEKLKAIREVKEKKAKAPMSEATKAKLKAYADKKKSLKIGKKK